MRSFLLPVLSFTLGLAASAIADPIISRWQLHEKRSHIPEGWTREQTLDPSASIPLRFALAQPNIEHIEALLYEVSHPDSPNYGNHWSPGQVAAKFAPSTESIETVRTWLIESGVEPHRVKISPTKGWLEVASTVEEAENLLLAEYHVYNHETGTKHIACDSYHLPEHVGPHVDFVTPTIHFDVKIRKRNQHNKVSIGQPGQGSGPKTSGVVQDIISQLKDCDKQTTPICLRTLYGLWYEPVSGKNNSYGIVEYTPQAYLQSDLDMFAKNFSTGLEGVSPTMVSIDGGYLQTTNMSFDYNGESNLDLQYGMTLVTKGQDVTLYQVGDAVEGASFNNFLDALDGDYCTYDGGDDPSQDLVYPDTASGGYTGAEDCGTVKPANVISTSYGYNEADLSAAYAIRQCNEYAKLGLLGVTVLYSSGDWGVAGSNGHCLNPDGTQTADGAIFNPAFPSTCPYVTSVGATQVSPGQSVWAPENACEQFIYSGGGFSNYFGMPDYQKGAVEGYLAANPISYSKNIYNSTGTSRAYPDLSANGANYVVAVDGNFTLIYGTSASTPVVGAILTMVNDARLALGKSTLGFINPTIYSVDFAGSFKDVTNGTNPGCGTVGFNATKGWDPVTGLGTPYFPSLLAKWLALK
ncbi:peptidase S8/S53 domain-containing protein [Suillus paluster]|uniref:peptidase S8/S53 domain-containing protein n=1 Tax=Suillus paluster TaxID=48578 RepID=UPI001B86A1B3|nr:peptidase S8/S53 domain-containing protein [Suillus paluster]KAG1727654.1 peptidase S8/S53 domain-containing protein [Suillus paluster]